MTRPSNLPIRLAPHDRALMRAAALREAATTAGARDLLLVRATGDRATLVETLVCGERWAGRLDLRLSAEPLLERALSGDEVVRSCLVRPQRVCGPYWTASAALVPRHGGADSVVVVLAGFRRQPSLCAANNAADAVEPLIVGDDPCR